MERLLQYLPYISLIVGGWAVVNGILHDVFVLIRHKTGYDRELFAFAHGRAHTHHLSDKVRTLAKRSGIIQMIAYKGLGANANWGYWVAGVATISLLIYCGMIFPFLKSFGTITLNLFLLVMLIAWWTK